MQGLCVGKGIVIGTFGCKTMRNCVYNETAENQRSFIGNVSHVVSESDTSCHFAFT